MSNIKSVYFLVAVLCCLNSFSQKQSNIYIEDSIPHTMINPSMDNPNKEWSYSPKSTIVIGVPFVPAPVQVLYDASVYTGNAELCFFYGDGMKKIIAHQRSFYNGWIPIVQYDWVENELHYFIEMFSTSLMELGNAENTLQLAKFKVINESKEIKKPALYFACRGSGEDHRKGKTVIKPETVFKMDKVALYSDGKLVYTFPDGGEKYSVNGKVYSDEFSAKELNITTTTKTGIVKYSKNLSPKDSLVIVTSMPRVPVETTNTQALSVIRNINYNKEKQKTIKFWTALISNKVEFKIPEKRVNDSYKAGLVNLILATRNKKEEGLKRQGSGLPYDGLFLNDFVDMRYIYDFARLTEIVEPNFKWLMNQQTDKGMFVDKSLSHGQEILASHGQALFTLSHHFVMTQDKQYAATVFPYVSKAIDWMKEECKKDNYGLLPPSIPYDNEMIKGHYTSHNLWGLLAVRASIRLARAIGKNDEVKAWTEFHDVYEKAVLKAISLSVTHDYYVPTGLYSFASGVDSRKGFNEFRTNQDWENNLLAYPTEVLAVGDERIEGTVDYIRKNKYREGVMTYRNGEHLHQYITCNQATQYLTINKQEQALTDLYHILLHNGSCHEGFENMVQPWDDRDPWPCPAPHAWAAAKISLLIRNCMVREYGGKAGLNENERDLYLYSLISPEWSKAGQKLEIVNAPTEFGAVSSTCCFTAGGAEIKVKSSFHHQPRSVIFTIPYSVDLISYKSDASKSELVNGTIICSSDVSNIKMIWKEKPGIFKNTYQNILQTYRSERGIAWEKESVKGKERSRSDAKNNSGILMMTPHAVPFLLEDEINYPAENLSFDLVLKAFQKEYKRRFDKYSSKTKIVKF